jgi:hypothetical protein
MKYLLTFLLVAPLLTEAQNYPRNYFIPPLDTPLVITGSFGEIRNEHVHAGIDISTNDQEGLPVYCAANGYISRVKVAPDGYGKAVYVTHPNGFVTVYGHLEKFTGGLYEFVRKFQYENQVFEVDEKFDAAKFPVRQRDIIGYSGSSGGADGPHLHFEVRDEKTEEPVNPLLFGIPFSDHKKPMIKYVRIIPRPEGGIVEKTDTAQSYDLVPDEGGSWRLNVNDYPIVFGNISIAISTGDSIDAYDEGELNIYSAELFVDDKPAFSWRYDRLNYDNMRDVNAHLDYLSKVRDHQIFEKFSRAPGDRLPIYADTSLTGNLIFDTDAAHNIHIVVRDFKGNMTEAKFEIISYVSAAENKYQPRNPDAIPVARDKGVAIHKSAYDIVIPEGAMYDDSYYDDEVLEPAVYSDIYRIGNEYVPLRMPITVGIKPYKELPDSLGKKLCVVRIGEYDIPKSLGGEWKGKFLTAKSNYFGKFVLMPDTIPPKVEKFYVPADLNSMYGGEVRVKITDDLSGIKTYSGTIDGKWRLFEYDKKNDMLIANIDPLMENKEHSLVVTVTDERGNTTVWKSVFYF